MIIFPLAKSVQNQVFPNNCGKPLSVQLRITSRTRLPLRSKAGLCELMPVIDTNQLPSWNYRGFLFIYLPGKKLKKPPIIFYEFSNWSTSFALLNTALLMNSRIIPLPVQVSTLKPSPHLIIMHPLKRSPWYIIGQHENSTIWIVSGLRIYMQGNLLIGYRNIS